MSEGRCPSRAYTPVMAARRDPPLVRALASATPVVSVELRPPRAELDAAAGMDAWIDTYHGVSGLVRGGSYVFLTDSAVGASEENNLRHLVINLGSDVPRDRVVPFLTTKHTLEFCLAYAERAWQEGFTSLVVLGGDRTIGPPRCVDHAWQLREAIREQVPDLTLGGWANPHANPSTQGGYLEDPQFTGEFFLTQVVSHHDSRQVERFLEELHRRQVMLPGIFGTFYYRSANPKTLATLSQFLPVPAEGLTQEFGAGTSPEEICARTIRALRGLGVQHVYVSNLPVAKPRQTLERILALV
jgi:5,10-methylenetetrahydrofolate reductase